MAESDRDLSGETERDFLGLVVHELRSPIAAIVGLAATLESRRHNLSEERIDESLRRIHEQGDRLAHLVDDLLDLAQVGSGRFRVALEPVQLARACSRALADAPPPDDCSVEVAVDWDLWVSADPVRLEQVLVNLLTNAYRYGGPEVWVGARRTADGVLVTVSDDGTGVPEHLVGSVFDRFSRGTSDGHGAGLGLAVVRGLVEAFGGRVWYEGGRSIGACFALVLKEAEPRLDNARSGRIREDGSRT